VSVGIIVSDHDYHSREGPLLQVEVGHRLDVKAGVGYGAGVEYSPYGHNRDYDTRFAPGFGPHAGYGIKHAQVLPRRRDWPLPAL